MAMVENSYVPLHYVIELLCQKVYTDLMRLVDMYVIFLPFNARLPPFSLFLAIDVFTNRGYTRLPKCITNRFLPQANASELEKKQALIDLDRIILHRLSVTTLPKQFRHVSISSGKVTFTVPSEFQVTLTLMSEVMDFPWRVLKVKLILKDPEFGPTNKIIHPKQNQFLQAHLQSRIIHRSIDPRPPLSIIYETMHSFCMALQLDLLHEQAQKSKNRRFDGQMFIESYKPGHSMCVSYWRELAKNNFHASLQADGKLAPQAYMLMIHLDELDPLKPLVVTHLPKLSIEDEYRIGNSITGENVSFERLFSKTLFLRSELILEDIRRELMLLTPGPIKQSHQPLCLDVPILYPCADTELLRIRLDAAEGSLRCCFCGIGGPETRLQTEAEVLNSDLKLVASVHSALVSLERAINKPSMRRIDQNVSFSSIQSRSIRTLSNEDSRQRFAVLDAFEKLRVFLALVRIYHTATRNRASWQPVCRTLPISLPKVKLGKAKPPYYDIVERMQEGTASGLFIKLFSHQEQYLFVEVQPKSGSQLINYKLAVLVLRSEIAVPFLRVTHYIPLDENLLSSCTGRAFNAIEYKSEVTHLHETHKRRCSQNSEMYSSKRPRLESSVEQELIYSKFTSIEGLDNLIASLEENLLCSWFVHELSRFDLAMNGFKYDETGEIVCVDMNSVPLNMLPSWMHSASKALESELVSMRLRPKFNLKHQAAFRRTWQLTVLFSERLITSKRLYSFEFTSDLPLLARDLVPKWMALCAMQTLVTPLLSSGTLPAGVELSQHDLKSCTVKYGSEQRYILEIFYARQFHINLVGSTTASPHAMIKHHLELFLNSQKDLSMLINLMLETLPFYEALDCLKDASLTSISLPLTDSRFLRPVRNLVLLSQSAKDVILLYRNCLALRFNLHQPSATGPECLLNTADGSPGFLHLTDAFSTLNNNHFGNLVPLPAFTHFLATLEDCFPVGNAETTWPGLSLSNLKVLARGKLGRKVSSLESYFATALMFHAAHIACLQLGGRVEGTSVEGPLTAQLTKSNVTSRGELLTSWQAGLQTRLRMVPLEAASWGLQLEIQPFREAAQSWNPAADCLYLLEQFFMRRVFVAPFEPVAMKTFFTIFQLPVPVIKGLLRIISWELCPPSTYDIHTPLAGPSESKPLIKMALVVSAPNLASMQNQTEFVPGSPALIVVQGPSLMLQLLIFADSNKLAHTLNFVYHWDRNVTNLLLKQDDNLGQQIRASGIEQESNENALQSGENALLLLLIKITKFFRQPAPPIQQHFPPQPQLTPEQQQMYHHQQHHQLSQ
ncbi:Mediator of RNA polymerase II transcription subunit 14 [Cichlidogyrus casuarinus]|uniref:Mediator of RNA polymerase II transcription subunit 14 n=1 Tax=Cichlidogyrus casuarinus TaxID=1844966 RepID=A0ABD2Q6I4_9PLAT